MIKKKNMRENLQMAFNLIIGQTVNLHQLPDLLWGGNCIFQTKKRQKIITN